MQTEVLCATTASLLIIVFITKLEGHNKPQTLSETIFSNEYSPLRRMKRKPVWPPVYPTPDYTKAIKLKVNCSEEDKNCNTTRKWNKYVPYKIEDNMSQSLKTAVKYAVKNWNYLFKDCIEFTERKLEENYVEFQEATTCHSKIGRILGKQVITLDRDDCSSFGKIAHEMMHTVGLRHEHNRPDRDDYIKVLFKDLPPDWIQEYMKYEDFFFVELRTTPYDYYSVMHYPVVGPDKYTTVMRITKRNIELDKVGQQKNMTSNDILKVKTLYCRKTLNSIH